MPSLPPPFVTLPPERLEKASDAQKALLGAEQNEVL
jgi:hypothetical protein